MRAGDNWMCIFELINVRVIGTDAHLNSIRRQVLTTGRGREGETDRAATGGSCARAIDRFERHGIELHKTGVQLTTMTTTLSRLARDEVYRVTFL